jgi:hypothetical protein
MNEERVFGLNFFIPHFIIISKSLADPERGSLKEFDVEKSSRMSPMVKERGGDHQIFASRFRLGLCPTLVILFHTCD